MKKPKVISGGGIYARLARIEGKCNYIISRLDRPAHEPRRDEMDNIVSRLHATAKSIAKECREERLFFADVVNRYKK